jgi:hypothetical protein
MTENSAIFNARHGAGSFRPHRQPAPTAQDCLKRGNGANWRTTRHSRLGVFHRLSRRRLYADQASHLPRPFAILVADLRCFLRHGSGNRHRDAFSVWDQLEPLFRCFRQCHLPPLGLRGFDGVLDVDVETFFDCHAARITISTFIRSDSASYRRRNSMRQMCQIRSSPRVSSWIACRSSTPMAPAPALLTGAMVPARPTPL